MNDSVKDREDRSQSGGNVPESRPGIFRSSRRSLLYVAIVLLIGLAALAVIRQLTSVPPPADGACEWTLRFPGPSPGATFKTAPGDDIRRLLDILLVDANADWHRVLKETGTVRIELSHISTAPLAVRLLWRFWGPEGTPPPDRIGRSLLTMEMRRVLDEPARYALIQVGSGGTETVTGTFGEYANAEDAVLDHLAEAMVSVHSQYDVGCRSWLPTGRSANPMTKWKKETNL
jgi:hypothetical protein